MRSSLAGHCLVGLVSGLLCAHAGAQGIFTCVDSKGRRLTADRPIAECTDREQRELTKNGMVKRKLGPTLTAEERAVEEEKARKALEEKNRQQDEKRRERALLTRYPDKAAHDKERQAALAAADESIKSANVNTEFLTGQRKKIELDMEFYKNDPKKIPAALRRLSEENAQQLDTQKRFVANQEAEKKRINTRFDEEQVKLKQLWAQRGGTPSGATTAKN